MATKHKIIGDEWAARAPELAEWAMQRLVNQGERAARMVTSALIDRGVLTAKSHRAPLRLAFPVSTAERWSPLLYPADASGGGE